MQLVFFMKSKHHRVKSKIHPTNTGISHKNQDYRNLDRFRFRCCVLFIRDLFSIIQAFHSEKIEREIDYRAISIPGIFSE